MSSRPAAHLDPRSPFVVDSHELGRRAGSMLELRRELLAPSDWELELVRVLAGSPVQLDLRLESVMDGVLVTASMRAAVAAECGRCLAPVSETIEVALSELFVYTPDPDDEEIPVLDGDLLDLESVLRDAVVLALPLNPRCDDACPGLCSTCGVRLDDAEPGHTHDALDPRWSALSALHEQNSPSSATMDDQHPASPTREF